MKHILLILLRSKPMDLRLCLASLLLSGGLAACQVDNTPPDLLDESHKATEAMDFLYEKDAEPAIEWIRSEFKGEPCKVKIIDRCEMQLPDGTRQSIPAGTIFVYPPKVPENSSTTPL